MNLAQWGGILSIDFAESLIKRRFGFLSLFAFSCTLLATWETVLV